MIDKLRDNWMAVLFWTVVPAGVLFTIFLLVTGSMR